MITYSSSLALGQQKQGKHVIPWKVGRHITTKRSKVVGSKELYT